MEKSLSENWFWEGTIDFEYKKYLLLAYLQHVSREFAEVRLYPSFSELIFHYNNLHAYLERKEALRERFPQKLDEDAIRQLRLKYEQLVEEHEGLKEVDAIVRYALPTLKGHIRDGKELYETIVEQMQIEPIGISPLYKREGYIFLQVRARSHIRIFQYRIIFLENAAVHHYGISLNWVENFQPGLAATLESRKHQLIRTRRELPNPATWLIQIQAPFPEEAALIPVTKREMLRLIRMEEQTGSP